MQQEKNIKDFIGKKIDAFLVKLIFEFETNKRWRMSYE